MPSDLRNWLQGIGLGKYLDTFVENEIDLEALQLLNDADLRNLGLPLGPRRKLQNAVEKLRNGGEPTLTSSQSNSSDHEGEKRHVTVLFADLCDFTRMSTLLDPEEIHELLNRFFEITDGVVTDYGGKIDKHIGDSVMAVFGAPIARTDDPLRAVRAASAIHEKIAKLDTGLDTKLATHIGIASGSVVASQTGSDAYSEYTVTGDTVNLASRLESIAGAGETLVSDSIFIAVGDSVAGEPLESITVEGFPAPLKGWRITGVVTSNDQRTQHPIIGRMTEQQLFKTLLSQTVENSRGHAILVRGEPGIGKTRLVGEFLKSAQERGLSVHRSLVLDFGVARGQDAMGLLVRSLLSLNSNALREERQAAAATAAKQGTIDYTDLVFLNDLLDLSQTTEQQGQYDAMDVENRNEGKRSVISALVRSSAAARPMVVAIEDVHWADDFTLSCLVRLASSFADLPVLLVMTSRLDGPSRELTWAAAFQRISTTTMDLQPLQPNETLDLARSVAGMLGGRVESIAARSEGNPLFLEQLIRNAVEGQYDNLPGTLQGLVLARADRLPALDREALVAASVLGQGFRLDELRAVLGKGDYEATQLIEQKLVRVQGNGLLFDHALIRDAIYASLLSKKRRELHAKAADHFDEKDPVLHAEHLDRAGDPEAANAYIHASNIEADAYRTETALKLAEKALAAAGDRRSRFLATCRLGELKLDMGMPDRAGEDFKSAAELAESAPEHCRTDIGLAESLRLVDKQSEALSVLDQIEPLALKEDHHEYLGRICYLRGNLLFILGDMEGCLRQHQRSYEYAKKAKDLETEARALGGLADAFYADGRMQSANDQFKRCVKLAEEFGLGRVAVANRSMIAITETVHGNIAGALALAVEAVEAARAVGQRRAEMVAHHAAHQSLWLLGRYDDSLVHCEQGLSLARKLGSPLFEAEALLFTGESTQEKGDIAAAYEYTCQAVSLCREHGMAFIGPIALGRLAATSRNLEESEKYLLEGRALLDKGSLSHNHFWFYRDAIEVALNWRLWDQAEEYFDALEEYASREPVPITDFIVARGKALTAFGRGTSNGSLVKRMRDLHQTAQEKYVPLAEKLAEALR